MKTNISSRLQRTVVAALMAALCCVATMVISIPSPPTGGYVNLGDCFVLLSGWMLGAGYGFAAAGIGSALADIILGYGIYAPGTFLIKGAMALVAALLFRITRRENKWDYLRRLLSALVAEVVMVAGYYVYEALFIVDGGWIVSLEGIPGNVVQGIVGIIAAIALCGVADLSTVIRKHARKVGML